MRTLPLKKESSLMDYGRTSKMGGCDPCGSHRQLSGGLQATLRQAIGRQHRYIKKRLSGERQRRAAFSCAAWERWSHFLLSTAYSLGPLLLLQPELGRKVMWPLLQGYTDCGRHRHLNDVTCLLNYLEKENYKQIQGTRKDEKLKYEDFKRESTNRKDRKEKIQSTQGK